MFDEKKALKHWGESILEVYTELGQEAYDEKEYQDLEQYTQEGKVTGMFNSDATREIIEPWLTSLAVMVNGRTEIQIAVDNLVVANLKKIEE